MRPLSKVLIANRGEIVARVARACHARGIASVAIYSDADRNQPFVSCCDQAIRIGGRESRDSYLRADVIVEAALASGADAIHPGYGFLSESARFALACADAGLCFVGPSPDVLAQLGNKRRARELAIAAGIPVVPGYHGEDQSDAGLLAAIRELGLPALLKASAGGGGRGMRVVRGEDEASAAIAAARREAGSAFGDHELLVERYIERPRHIEVQILADEHGNVIALGDRECSIQRRHQKIIEEAPAPGLADEQRAAMSDAAIALARAVGYTSAGTVEFIVDDDGRFYFLEVNARLQVEHRVTELVTGIDIVAAQLRIASGAPLLCEDRPPIRGHAIECRLCAEESDADFLPQSGTLADFFVPEVEGFSVEAALTSGTDVPPYYDSMLAKLLAWGEDRGEALARMRRGLAHLSAAGVATNQTLLRRVLELDAFAAAALHTHFLAEHRDALFDLDPPEELVTLAVLAAVAIERADDDERRAVLPHLPLGFSNNPLPAVPIFFDLGETRLEVRRQALADGALLVVIGEREHRVDWYRRDGLWLELEHAGFRHRLRVVGNGRDVHISGSAGQLTLRRRPSFPEPTSRSQGGAHLAPMPGKVIAVLVREGDAVDDGQELVVVEAMKMEHRIRAHSAGTVRRVAVGPGDQLEHGQLLIRIDDPADM